ncbi:MAG: DNA polymerase III subunit epsilon [Hyphomicrobium sp.]|jgi:DNA polymerase-3 subunit epsilon
MREIILDTETTGLDPMRGDRLVEIGCIELINRIPTGREYHCFINPERDVPAEAERVHGITTAFLRDKPKFAEVASDFLAFIAEDGLVIHNAAFDIGFLNFELSRVALGKIAMDRVTCTLQLAKRRHPAGPNNLDALCKRYGIDNTKRTKHGALVDSLLLAEVYIELLGVRQAAFVELAVDTQGPNGGEIAPMQRGNALRRPHPLQPRLTAEMESAHAVFVETLGEQAIWRRFLVMPGDSPAESRSPDA